MRARTVPRSILGELRRECGRVSSSTLRTRSADTSEEGDERDEEGRTPSSLQTGRRSTRRRATRPARARRPRRPGPGERAGRRQSAFRRCRARRPRPTAGRCAGTRAGGASRAGRGALSWRAGGRAGAASALRAEGREGEGGEPDVGAEDVDEHAGVAHDALLRQFLPLLWQEAVAHRREMSSVVSAPTDGRTHARGEGRTGGDAQALKLLSHGRPDLGLRLAGRTEREPDPVERLEAVELGRQALSLCERGRERAVVACGQQALEPADRVVWPDARAATRVSLVSLSRPQGRRDKGGTH